MHSLGTGFALTGSVAMARPVKEHTKLIWESFCKGVVDLINREGLNLDFH
jgi:hypothetical protein